jgi:threonylcarbamoyladenosine tRNA methylthiotransferase MtaB
VIAGFPGESRQEVGKATEEFLGLPISYLHVFPYSERAGTAAARLGGAVSVTERKRRAAVWRELGEARRKEFLKRLVGQELEVIVERISGSFVYGTSREYAPARIALLREHGDTSQEHLTIGARTKVRAVAYDESEKKLICL